MTDNGRDGSQDRSKSVTSYDYPSCSSLRRVWAWQAHPVHGPSIERIAHHEAGHVVLFEWLGLSGLKAEATPTSGLAYFPEVLPERSEPSDPTGELAATAAAVFHAGTCAELIYLGEPWRGPIFRLSQSDHQRADEMLKAAFQRHHSGAHAFAQRVALHVLSKRWERVEEVANVLVERGEWRSYP